MGLYMYMTLIGLSMIKSTEWFSGWLSKNCDENPCTHAHNFHQSRRRACADSRRNFWTTNQKTTVLDFFPCTDMCRRSLPDSVGSRHIFGKHSVLQFIVGACVNNRRQPHTNTVYQAFIIT